MNTYEKLVQILSENLSVDEDKITKESNLKDDLGADSIDLVELIMVLEDEFGKEFDEDDMDSIETVEDILEYIE